MPQVSVVIPSYNLAEYLGQAIQSVLDQTYSNLEAIVVDDGSTDNTRQVASAFDDPRVRYVYQENIGPAGARNAGIRVSQGEYLVFLDADDLLLPWKLEVQVRALDSNPKRGLVGGGYQFLDESGSVLCQVESWKGNHSLTTRDWLLGCPFVVHAVLIRRHWVEAVGAFDMSLSGGADYDFWLRLAHAGCPMGWVRDVVCSYRLRTDSMVHDVGRQKRETLRVLDKFYSNPDLPLELVALKRRAYAMAHLQGAARAYGAQQIVEAQRDVLCAIELMPELVKSGEVLEILLRTADSPLVTRDPGAYTQTVLNGLPEPMTSLEGLRRKAYARIWMAEFFEAQQRRDWPRVRRTLLKAVRHDPAWLRNRGVWSIVLESLLGSQIMGYFRNALSKNCREA